MFERGQINLGSILNTAIAIMIAGAVFMLLKKQHESKETSETDTDK